MPRLDQERDGSGAFTSSVTDEEIWAYFEVDPSVKRCAEHFGYSRRGMRQRLAKIREKMGVVREADPGRASKLEQLISSVPLEGPEGSKLRAVDVKIWGVAAKDNDGNLITKGLDGIKARYKLDEKASVQWPPIAPQYVVDVTAYKPLPPQDTDFERVFIWGDTQAHFWRENGRLVPFHDEAAIDIGLQALALYQPHRIVIIGDFLDLPGFGKYRKEPGFAFTTNAAIAYATELLAKMRAIVGKDCRIDFILGNHEARITSAIVDNLSELYDIRRPGDTFSLVSIPFLLQFEKFDIHCSAQYPSGEVWLTDDLVCTHAPDKRLRATQVCGHLVKATKDSESFHYREGRKTYRTHVVPGFGDYTRSPIDEMRLTRTNIPSNVGRSNAEQAFATIAISKDKKRHHVQVWDIENGAVFFQDRWLTGTAENWRYIEDAA